MKTRAFFRALPACAVLAIAACGREAASPGDPSAVIVPVQPPQASVAPPAPARSAAAPAPLAALPFRCESGGKRFDIGGRGYCAYSEPDSWEASERRCVAGGGHLVALESAEKSEALHAALGSPLNAGRAAWIGLELKTKWRWVSGDPATATSWNDGEPNNFDGHEACGEWLVADGLWNDTRCELEQPYLCQSRPAKTLTCKNGRPFADGGTSYCLHGANRTFADAKRACLADGGILAVLDTKEKNGAVRDAVAARFAATKLWIGLADLAATGAWRWTSGAPTGFTAWFPGEPNDFGGEHCVELYADSWTWNDFECGAVLPSVCESTR